MRHFLLLVATTTLAALRLAPTRSLDVGTRSLLSGFAFRLKSGKSGSIFHLLRRSKSHYLDNIKKGGNTTFFIVGRDDRI